MAGLLVDPLTAECIHEVLDLKPLKRNRYRMRLASLFIIYGQLDFVCFVDGDLEFFIPPIGAGGVCVSSLRSFNFERYVCIYDLLRRGTRPS
jgi:hypothetical protein